MKVSSLLLIGALALTACGKSENANTESNKRKIIETDVNDTKFGKVIDVRRDSIQWTEDETGNTSWISTHLVQMRGSMAVGHNIAVLFKDGSNTQLASILDCTELIGRWVEPDGVEEGMVRGMELQEGGVASTIGNSDTYKYQTWRIYNGELLLGFSNSSIPEDTFHITYLATDSMLATNAYMKHFYRRSNGGEDDLNRDYGMYTSPDANAFDPEGDMGEGEFMEIPEYDRAF